MIFDIHSHILHNIDDGAKSIDESVALLEEMYLQGITDVIATPHFYPQVDILEDFIEKAHNSFSQLKNYIKDKKVPNIYLGAEVLYYSGISKASSLKEFTLNGADYILLEPNCSQINKGLFKELLYLRDTLKITPIIAHIERYHKERGFKDFLKFIKENRILTQVNATSFFGKHYTRILKKLIKEDIITFIASDTHSLDLRPPMISDALQKIEEQFGNDYKLKLIKNSEQLFSQIANKGNVL